MFLFICDRTHPGNYFFTEHPATEMGEDGILRFVDAQCKCGGVARWVHANSALLPVTEAEVHAVDMVCESLGIQ